MKLGKRYHVWSSVFPDVSCGNVFFFLSCWTYFKPSTKTKTRWNVYSPTILATLWNSLHRVFTHIDPQGFIAVCLRTAREEPSCTTGKLRKPQHYSDFQCKASSACRFQQEVTQRVGLLPNVKELKINRGKAVLHLSVDSWWAVPGWFFGGFIENH